MCASRATGATNRGEQLCVRASDAQVLGQRRNGFEDGVREGLAILLLVAQSHAMICGPAAPMEVAMT